MQLSYSGRQAMKTRSQSRKYQDFGKAWNINDKLSIFFPIFWSPELDEDGDTYEVQDVDNFGRKVYNDDGTPKMVQAGQWDIVTSYIWGHPVGNMKAFGVGGSFIPSLTDVVRGQPVKILRDEKGAPLRDVDGEVMTEPIPGDITYQFSKIAPLFIKGAKQEELTRIENKTFTEEALRREAIREIEDKYDTGKSIDAPRPVVGKLQMVISTEVIVVKHANDDSYMVDDAAQYTYKLSDKKLSQLISLLDDVKYKPRDTSVRWFEVQMTFNGNDNTQRGRGQASMNATPSGLTEEYRMESRDPSGYEKLKSKLINLPQDSETISCRNYTYTKIAEKKIERCISKYVTLNSDVLDSIKSEEDIEVMTGSASRLIQFGILDNMANDDIKKKVLKAYDEYLEKHPELRKQDTNLATEQEGYAEPKFDTAPTARDLLTGVDGIELPDDSSLDYNADNMIV